MWSASSWAMWKQCPHKLQLREQKWSTPRNKPDSRSAIWAVPGLVVDKLFQLWFYRREFYNKEWLQDNFDLVWEMTLDQKRPKWMDEDEHNYIRVRTQKSVAILYKLLHQHELLNEKIGIQTEFHEPISDGISIAGAIDLWSIRNDGKLVVVDFKNFGSNSHRSVDQLHFYAMALKRILGREPDEAGYVCFHPGYEGYRKAVLRPCDRNRLLARIKRATVEKQSGNCPAKYSFVTCPRFCEMRFQCTTFKQKSGLLTR